MWNGFGVLVVLALVARLLFVVEQEVVAARADAFSLAAFIVTILGAATGAVQGEKAAASQRAGIRSQKQAQRQSLLASAAQEKLAAQATRKANQKKPDVSSMLFAEQQRGSLGAASTLLSGNKGGGTLLGGKTTLGG